MHEASGDLHDYYDLLVKTCGESCEWQNTAHLCMVQQQSSIKLSRIATGVSFPLQSQSKRAGQSFAWILNLIVIVIDLRKICELRNIFCNDSESHIDGLLCRGVSIIVTFDCHKPLTGHLGQGPAPLFHTASSTTYAST
jgi:hypothetical protein